MNVEIGAEAALFPEKEYINGIAIAVSDGPLCHGAITNRCLHFSSIALTKMLTMI
jgi:hypothetical protein